MVWGCALLCLRGLWVRSDQGTPQQDVGKVTRLRWPIPKQQYLVSRLWLYRMCSRTWVQGGTWVGLVRAGMGVRAVAEA